MNNSTLSLALAERRGRIEVVEMELAVRDLPSVFEGYRIAQLSDLHFGPCTSITHLRHAVELVIAARPDLIVLTGDYIQVSTVGVRHALATKVHPKVFRWTEYRRAVRRHAIELRPLLEALQAPDGVLGIFGNHDYLEGIGTIRRQFPRNIRWLVNDSEVITRGDAHVVVSGIDDLRYGEPTLKKTFENAAKELPPHAHKTLILLAHNPDVTLSEDADCIRRYHLTLCGHTHGGQLCLPGRIPLVTRTDQRSHVSGISEFAGAPIYVHRGVGYGGVPLRLFCPPEVTLFTLTRR
ncbi:MAG: metallophosphoesterase [Bdellovibrionales bacterium]|nr:metallophosphoesterase [Bdellovibrionales bacterium]